jgi:hypothetical protein
MNVISKVIIWLTGLVMAFLAIFKWGKAEANLSKLKMENEALNRTKKESAYIHSKPFNDHPCNSMLDKDAK